MSWLLGRDTYAALIRGVPRVLARCQQHAGRLQVSAVTVTVIEMWLLRPKTPARYLQGYQFAFQQVVVVPMGDAVARRAASIGSAAKPTQRPRMTLADWIVAATAVTHGLTLITADTQVFAGVSGLQLADWFQP